MLYTDVCTAAAADSRQAADASLRASYGATWIQRLQKTR